MNWEGRAIEETIESLQSSPQGLSTADAERRIEKYGMNLLEEGKKVSPLQMLLAQFKDVMILILLAAAIVSGIVGDITDSIVILVIVVLNACLGFVQEYRAEKAMKALKQMTVAQAHVLRDGQPTLLPATSLVPGDIVLLEAGNAVPADVRIIESK
ncbi:MAG: cation-transporting P-type ATPase, partial [Chitinophagaceae bacterium]